MYHIRKVRRLLSVVTTILLLTALLSACRESTISSSQNPAESSSATAVSTESTESTGISTATSSGSGTAESETVTETTTTGGGTTVAVPPVNNPELTLSLDQWHPGVADYDAEYMLVPVMDDQIVGYKQMTYSSSADGVKFSGNTVTIPYSVRSKGQPVTITGTEKSTGAKASLSINCKSWTASFGDEFNGTSLDTSKWGCHEEGSGVIAMMSSENATVANGKLSLWVKKEQKTMNGRTLEYTQGGISTFGKYTQMYGLFTCSMKIPKQSALNSAFWMFPGGAYGSTYHFYDGIQTTKGCGELDFVEISGYWGRKYCITEHFFDTADNKAHTSKHQYVDLPIDPTENFVEYSCAWMEDALYYYANGKLVWTDTSVSTTGGSNGKKTGRPGRIVLSLGMYSPEETWCGPWEFKDSDFPISLEVDYVRAYK